MLLLLPKTIYLALAPSLSELSLSLRFLPQASSSRLGPPCVSIQRIPVGVDHTELHLLPFLLVRTMNVIVWMFTVVFLPSSTLTSGL